MTARASLLVALGALLAAALGAIGVAAGEGTRLSLSELDPWLVVYAIGVLAMLGSAPYGLFDRYAASTDDEDVRWDRALSVWGGIALLAGLLFIVFGVIAGFDPATVSGSLAWVGAGACALVFGTLALFVLFGD